MLLEWAFGYAAGQVADSLFSAMRRDPLSRAIDDTLETWRKGLPASDALESSAALFSPEGPMDNGLKREALAHLRSRLASNHLPSPQEWLDALMEQWSLVATSLGEDAQAFFQLDPSKAGEHLADLSERLFHVTAAHARLFNPHVLSLLNTIQSDIDALNEAVATKQAASASMMDSFGRWSGLTYSLDGHFQTARDQKLPWPGEHYDDVLEENALYLKLHAFLRLQDPNGSVLAQNLDLLRDISPIDDRWDSLRKGIASAIMQAEGSLVP